MQNLPGEIWREIEIEDLPKKHRYDVSNMGRIRSKKGIIKGSNISGYPSLNLRIAGKAVNFYVHKLVAKYFLDEPDEEQIYVIHLDGDKVNNRHNNIKWAAKEELMAHRSAGMREKIKRVKNCKLGESQVKAIKALIEGGFMSQKAIAKKYKVSPTQVRRIRTGENWSNV
jgi:hypothetical protein